MQVWANEMSTKGQGMRLQPIHRGIGGQGRRERGGGGKCVYGP